MIRGSYLAFHVESNASLAARCTGPLGLAWFCVSLSDRGSHGARCTRCAHVASDGRGAPGAEVVKYPPSGTGDVRCLRIDTATTTAAMISTAVTPTTITLRRFGDAATAAQVK